MVDIINIDKKFNYLIKFIEERSLNQITEAIKQNFNYLKKNNPDKFMAITNYYNQYKLWGEIDLNNNIELIENNAKALVNHKDDFKWLYNNLNDYRSKLILTNILYYWLMVDDNKIKEIKDDYFSQYFDLDLIKCDKNEVFIDIGAYTGDTLIKYINLFGKHNYKKIYCYEMVPDNINYIKENIKRSKLENVFVQAKAATNKNGYSFIDSDKSSSITKVTDEGKIKVETVKIDDDLKGKVTFIKMDIEGGELSALEGLSYKIKKYKPKLAISVYHNNNHLWQIPKLLYYLNSGYKFYLRYYGGNLLPTEYILYAL